MSGLDAMFDRPDWWDDAECRTFDPSVFFPADGVGVARAQRICERCDVRQVCLEGALARREPDGVWGGTSERQRRRLLKASGIRTNYHPSTDPEEGSP